MNETAETALSLTGVVKRFGGRTAVEGLDLEVPRGSVYGLLGPNGAGKTTTLRIVLRILEPDAGSVRVFGRPVGDVASEHFGYLPEERGLYNRMRVTAVLSYLAELKGLPPRRSAPRIAAWLERMGLADRAHARVHELSKGMQQKLQFIAAVLHEPPIVILDEPFSGLDPIHQGVFKEIIQELRSEGRTILFSTHIIEHAERICDRVCILARGEKVVDGPLAQVRREHGGRYVALSFERWSPEETAALRRLPVVAGVREHGNEVEVRLTDDADPATLLEDLAARRLGLRRFEVVEASLEQIFLERVGPVSHEAQTMAASDA